MFQFPEDAAGGDLRLPTVASTLLLRISARQAATLHDI